MIIDAAHYHSLAPLFFRSFGGLCLLPIGEGVSGIGRQLGLALLITILLNKGQFSEPATYSALVCEFLNGFILGLPAALAIATVRSFGELFDLGRGQSLSSMYDPSNSVQSSTCGLLGEKLAFCVVLAGGVLEQIITALASSPTTPSQIRFDQYAKAMLSLTVSGAATAFSGFVAFALLFLLIDMIVMFLAKTLLNASLMSETFQLKTCSGMLALIVMFKYDLAPMLLGFAHPRAVPLIW